MNCVMSGVYHNKTAILSLHIPRECRESCYQMRARRASSSLVELLFGRARAPRRETMSGLTMLESSRRWCLATWGSRVWSGKARGNGRGSGNGSGCCKNSGGQQAHGVA